MTKLKFTVLVEQDEDGAYIGTVPDIKGCHSYGETLDELMTNIKRSHRRKPTGIKNRC